MSALKPPSPQNIPVLRDVVVPGQRAARGQTARDARRASDVAEPAAPEVAPEVDDSAIYESLLGEDFETIDIEGAIDRVLDRHSERLREELRREFERLLEQARRSGGTTP